MKKTLLPAILPLVWGLSSCGNSGPEAEAEKICDMMKEWKEARDAGNREKADKIEAEGKKIREELKEKYKEDDEGRKVLDEKLDACREEVEG